MGVSNKDTMLWQVLVFLLKFCIGLLLIELASLIKLNLHMVEDRYCSDFLQSRVWVQTSF